MDFNAAQAATRAGFTEEEAERLDVKTRGREIDRFYWGKLSALNEIGKRMGLWGPLQNVMAGKRSYCLPDEILYLLAFRVADREAHPIQRHAAAKILDYHIPGWRERVSVCLLGGLVDRDDSRVKVWKRAVHARDRCCQECGALEDLHAHHIVPWASAPEPRLVVENGVMLCSKCHAAEHSELPYKFVARVGGRD